MTITAAADGSALGNPGPAGWAWYVDDSTWRAGGWPHGTNNQGELMAVLDLFRATAHLPAEHLRILCDSQYVINCITKWMPGWKRKGWRKADGKPVLNVDLLRQIDDELKGRDYSFEWVKGHAGHDLNEAADVRARAVATAYQLGRTADTGPGFPGAPAEAPEADAVRPAGKAAATATASTTAAASTATASTTAAAPTATAGNAVAPSRTAAPAEQDDLFSSLEDPAEPGADPGAIALGVVTTLERELLDPASDFGQVGYLLHPDFRGIDRHGNLGDRDSFEGDTEATVGRFVPLESILVADGLAQLAYRLEAATGSLVVSSLWQRDADRWRLRFRQETPETPGR